MRLNETLAELTNDHEFLGEWLYHITVMGKPSATEPWGWQLDGHHAIINYFVLGDQVVMTPFFAGSEPVIATSGKYKGISILQDEQNRGLDMLLALDNAQRAKAILNPNKTGEQQPDRSVQGQRGARLRRRSAPPISLSRSASSFWIWSTCTSATWTTGHARVKMDEVQAALRPHLVRLDRRHGFTSVFYYRIHSPVILIEFDHQRPANLARFAKDPNLPTRQHIHCVVRTPNGNDYGKDLLRQHYQSHAHA